MPAPGKAPKRTLAATKKTQAAKRGASKSASAKLPASRRAPAALKSKSRSTGPTLQDVAGHAGGVSRNFGKGVAAVGRGVREAAATVIPFSRTAQTTTSISNAMAGAPAARKALKGNR